MTDPAALVTPPALPEAGPSTTSRNLVRNQGNARGKGGRLRIDVDAGLAKLETLGPWAEEVQRQLMVRYKAYLASSPAPTRKAVLRILIHTADGSTREVLAALNHADHSTRLARTIQAALDLPPEAASEALRSLRDPTTGRQIPYASVNIAAQHVRELLVLVNKIRKMTPARLETSAKALTEIDAVLADVAGTPNDAMARITELEAELGANNARWQERILALEARFDQVATGAATPPKPRKPRKPRKTPARSSSRAKKPPAA